MNNRVSQKEVFRGKTLAILENIILLNGVEANLESLHTPLVALMVAVTKDNEFILVQQYRQAIDEVCFEFPAGKVEQGEEPEDAARREVLEEAGILTDESIKLGVIYSSPEFSDELVYIYRTTSFQEISPSPEKHEKITVIKLDEETLISYILTGRLKDGKTIAAYMLYSLEKKKSAKK